MESAYKKITRLRDIPVSTFNNFFHLVNDLLQISGNICLHYYACPAKNDLRFICSILDPQEQVVYELAHELKDYRQNRHLQSMPDRCKRLKQQEQEIAEQFDLILINNAFDPLINHSSKIA